MAFEVVKIGPHTLYRGDCLDVLPTLAAGSVDAVVTDPPYAEIDRDYGRLTERQWHRLMHVVVTECRRVIAQTGSAVFIVQPNSERVGRMRMWVFDFICKWGRKWGLVQDAYWWNFTAVPLAGTSRAQGLMRSSMKPCVWLGDAKCYRNQDAVLWAESMHNAKLREADSRTLVKYPSGVTMRHGRAAVAAVDRGGVVPFNVMPCDNTDSSPSSAGGMGHGAGTPRRLCDFWVNYLCPPCGTLLDPFMGTATIGEAALHAGMAYVGIERMPEHFDRACRRIEAACDAGPLFREVVGEAAPDLFAAESDRRNELLQAGAP